MPTTARPSRPAATTGTASKARSTNGAARATPVRDVSSSRAASYTVPSLSLDQGGAVADQLQNRLVALLDLGLTLKHIHWNVVGPNFIGVHQMLDPQYAGISRMVDALAERIATLGGVPSGLPGRIVEAATGTTTTSTVPTRCRISVRSTSSTPA